MTKLQIMTEIDGLHADNMQLKLKKTEALFNFVVNTQIKFIKFIEMVGEIDNFIKAVEKMV